MRLQVGPELELELVQIRLPLPLPQLQVMPHRRLPLQLQVMPRRRLPLQSQALPGLVKVLGKVARVQDRAARETVVAKVVVVVVAHDLNVNPALGVTTELRDSRESVGPCGM
jgi:hypothetical protein